MAASNPPAEPPTPTIGQPVFFVEAPLFLRANPDSRACDRRRAAALFLCRFEAMALLTISYGSRVFKMPFHLRGALHHCDRCFSRWSRRPISRQSGRTLSAGWEKTE